MFVVRWIKRRSGRAPLTSSRDVAAELRRARQADRKVANHRPLRSTDVHVDPRNGVPPTP